MFLRKTFCLESSLYTLMTCFINEYLNFGQNYKFHSQSVKKLNNEGKPIDKKVGEGKLFCKAKCNQSSSERRWSFHLGTSTRN